MALRVRRALQRLFRVLSLHPRAAVPLAALPHPRLPDSCVLFRQLVGRGFGELLFCGAPGLPRVAVLEAHRAVLVPRGGGGLRLGHDCLAHALGLPREHHSGKEHFFPRAVAYLQIFFFSFFLLFVCL